MDGNWQPADKTEKMCALAPIRTQTRDLSTRAGRTINEVIVSSEGCWSEVNCTALYHWLPPNTELFRFSNTENFPILFNIGSGFTTQIINPFWGCSCGTVRWISRLVTGTWLVRFPVRTEPHAQCPWTKHQHTRGSSII